MLKLPSWFSASKKTDVSSAEVKLKLQTAEDAHAAAQARVEAARATLASERSDAAREALRAAKADTEEVAEMLAIVRADHAAAIERERQRHLAKVRAQRDEARAKRAEHLAREVEVTSAAALALIQGHVTLHRERETELRAACEADHEARRLSTELGEAEPDLHLSVTPSGQALADLLSKLGHGQPGVYELIEAVSPGYHRVAGLVASGDTRERLAEQAIQRNRDNPPAKNEVIWLDSSRQRNEGPPSMAKQMSDLLEGKAG